MRIAPQFPISTPLLRKTTRSRSCRVNLKSPRPRLRGKHSFYRGLPIDRSGLFPVSTPALLPSVCLGSSHLAREALAQSGIDVPR